MNEVGTQSEGQDDGALMGAEAGPSFVGSDVIGSQAGHSASHPSDNEQASANDQAQGGLGEDPSLTLRELSAAPALSETVDLSHVPSVGPADEAAQGEEAGHEVEDEGEIEPVVVARGGPIELIEDAAEDISLQWYILKVQSNRERSIAQNLQRKVAIEGIDRFFGEILVPTEKVTEFKAGKKKVVERKLWPGYIAVQMHFCDETWFAIRETSGIGDFTGASGRPTPMQPHEIALIRHKEEEVTGDAPKLNIKFKVGEKVKVTDGNFENFEGEVGTIDESSGKITVMLSIFGRSTPVELEYWQVEGV